MLQSLQSLRGIFAIMIFLHHFPVNGHGLFAAGGDCGVDFFIILSGFVMSAGYGSRAADTGFNYRRYMWRRIARLYPLHLLCLILYLVLYGWRIGAGTYARLVPNLFLLQSWIPAESFYFSGNAVSWCLSDFMFFYAVFPFLARFYHRARKWFLATLLAVTGAYFAFIWLLPERYVTPLVYIFPATRLLDFVIGMVLWRVVSCQLSVVGCQFSVFSCWQRGVGRAWRSVVEIATVGVTVAACVYFGDVTPRLTLASYWWIPSALTIMVFALHEKTGGGIVSKILTWKPLVTFGYVSFSFYMLHLLVIASYKLLLSYTGMTEHPWIALPVVFAVTVALSLVVYYRFELPVSARLNGKIR